MEISAEEEEKQHTRSVGSLVAGLGLVSLGVTGAIPLFPDKRTAAETRRGVGIPFFLAYLFGAAVILYDTWPWFHGKIWWCEDKLRQILRKCFPVAEKAHKSPLKDGSSPALLLQALPWIFFLLYIGVRAYKFANEVFFLVSVAGCNADYGILSSLGELLFACAMFHAMRMQDRIITASASGWKHCRWMYLIGCNLVTAIRYMVEEASWDFVDVVVESFDESAQYMCALNVTGYANPEDYVPVLYKDQTKCLRHMLFGHTVHVVLDALPASTEFFLLATCASLVVWRNLGADSGADGDGHCNADPAAAVPGADAADGAPAATPESNCFTWTFRMAIPLSVVAIVGTILSIVFMPYLAPKFDDDDGAGILSLTETSLFSIMFYSQQVFLQLVLLSLQVVVYVFHVRRIEAVCLHTKEHHQDIYLTIFPLLPIGAFLSLRLAPDIFPLTGDRYPPAPFNETQWRVLNIGFAAIQYTQAAFQSFFICAVLKRRHTDQLKCYSWTFLFMGVMNASIWITISLEAHRLGTHSRSCHPGLYGVISWVVISSVATPIILFYFAHTTFVFVEIFTDSGVRDWCSRKWNLFWSNCRPRPRGYRPVGNNHP